MFASLKFKEEITRRKCIYQIFWQSADNSSEQAGRGSVCLHMQTHILHSIWNISRWAHLSVIQQGVLFFPHVNRQQYGAVFIFFKLVFENCFSTTDIVVGRWPNRVFWPRPESLKAGYLPISSQTALFIDTLKLATQWDVQYFFFFLSYFFFQMLEVQVHKY